MVMQNLMRGEPEEEGWLGEAQGFIPCESGAVHLVSEQQHIFSEKCIQQWEMPGIS